MDWIARMLVTVAQNSYILLHNVVSVLSKEIRAAQVEVLVSSNCLYVVKYC